MCSERVGVGSLRGSVGGERMEVEEEMREVICGYCGKEFEIEECDCPAGWYITFAHTI